MPTFAEIPPGLTGDALIAAINETLRLLVTEREPQFLADMQSDGDAAFTVTVVNGAQIEVNRLTVGGRRPVLLIAKGVFRATAASSTGTLRLLRGDLTLLDQTGVRLDPDAGATARRIGYALVAAEDDPAESYVVTVEGGSATGGQVENHALVAVRL